MVMQFPNYLYVTTEIYTVVYTVSYMQCCINALLVQLNKSTGPHSYCSYQRVKLHDICTEYISESIMSYINFEGVSF